MPRSSVAPFGLLVALALALVAVPGSPARVAAEPSSPPPEKPAPAKPQYNRDVRPILAENCFACHGPDSAARKAGLRLDQRDKAVEKGAIEPGKPDASELVARILAKPDADGLMPPKKSHKALTAAQKETLKRWVAQGAEYESHWSFIPPKPQAVPTVGKEHAGWVKTPIDAFVLQAMLAKGLTPAPEADRRTLARRLALDLTGLPPDPADVEAFVADQAADWYEKYVDRLMASEQWGEHRGRYWLDYARYADTHGIHFDNYRENWAYRDWVIRALNRNLRFDQFATEQLAGDLLPNPTLDQKVATGFNRSNITTNEGGSINEEVLVQYTRDRTETSSQVFLGLTAGCAVCHDHKFDPVSQKDFYSLAAFFNNTTQGAMDGNIKDTPPNLFVPAAADREKWSAFADRLKAAEAKVAARRVAARGEFDGWLKAVKADDVKVPTAGLTFHAPLNEGKDLTVKTVVAGKEQPLKLPDGVTEWKAGPFGTDKALAVKPKADGTTVAAPAEVGDFEADKPFSYAAWVLVPQKNQIGAAFARMDEKDAYRGWDLFFENGKFAVHLIHSFPKDSLKLTTTAAFDTAKWHHVAVTYDGSRKASGMAMYVDGAAQPVSVLANDQKQETKEPSPSGTARTKVPLTFGRRTPGQGLKEVGLADLRLYDRALTAAEAGELAASGRILAVLAKPADKRQPKEVDELFNWWIATRDQPTKTLAAELEAVKKEEAAFKMRGTTTPISVEKPTPPEAYILNRGDYDKRGEKVGADTPKALPPFGKDLPRNRLGLAKWLLQPDHPLTARVTVNRFWQEVFGQGLVRSAGDFGITGDPPTHPELLDWLALDFRSDWDVKRFFRQVVLSGTYRQAATTTNEKVEKDPGNAYLSRGPRFRMDAEMVRDYALATSGLLVKAVGGPSVRPYQPEGVWEAVAMPESNTRNYTRDTGDGLYRRSMYTLWKRAAPPAAMEVLNAPNRETCAVRRERTNTPLQALLTLNDVQYVEAARVLAEATLKAAPQDDARADFVARRLLARPLTAAEKAVVTESLAALLKDFRAAPADAKKLLAVGDKKADPKLDAGELAAWTMLCNQLLNLDEVLNK